MELVIGQFTVWKRYRPHYQNGGYGYDTLEIIQ